MSKAFQKSFHWREVHLADVVDQESPICYGIVLPGDHCDGGVPVIKVKDIGQGSVRTTGLLKTSPVIDAKYKRSRLSGGDILLSIRGTIGRLGLVPKELTGANITQDTARIRISCIETRNYVYQALQSDDLQTQIRDHIVGQAVKGINIRDVKRLKLLLPTERRAQKYIAELLNTQDTAIQKAEQLIAAKARSSKAHMQRVFEKGPYTQRPLSDITHRITRKNLHGDGHPLTISGAEGLVSQSLYFGKRIAAEKTEHYTLLKKGEYAYNRSYSAGYPLGAIKRLDALDEGIVSTLYLCFALNGNEAPMSDYFAYFCEAGGFNHQIYQVAQEGARNHGLLNVTADDFFSMTMPVPTRDVQERVVKVLGAAMKELSLLRDQLDALRRQKRGLMQKLLTGEWLPPIHKEGH